jgi:hypothetical protein
MYRAATSSEIEYLALRYGELRADAIAQAVACARCPCADSCPVAYCPDPEDRHLALRECPTAPFAMAMA